MPSFFTRFLFSLTTLAPLYLSLPFIFVSPESRHTYFLITSLLYILVAFIALGIIQLCRKKLELIPVPIKTAERLDFNYGWLYFLAYVLPFSFNLSHTFTAITIQTIMVIMLVIFGTAGFSVNPILRLFGYHLFHITLVHEKPAIVILMSRKKSIDPTKSLTIVQINYNLFLEI